MAKIAISDVPEHLERVIIRPLVENFCYSYIYEHKLDSFSIKMVEYDKTTQAGRADLYFNHGTSYTHIILKIPVHKKMVNGKTQVTVDDPVIEVLNKDSPKGRKPFA